MRKTKKRRAKKRKSKKPINVERIQQSTKKIYEMSSEISFLQEELDDMLSVINKNFMDYKKGKISHDFFRSNEKKLKTKSVSIISKINRLVEDSSRHNDKIVEEIKKQLIRV